MELMTWLIEELLKKFDHSPEIGKLLIANTEVLVHADMKKQAKEFVEYCITGRIVGLVSISISSLNENGDVDMKYNGFC